VRIRTASWRAEAGGRRGAGRLAPQYSAEPQRSCNRWSAGGAATASPKSQSLSEKGVRLAQKMQVGPCIPMGIQLEKAGVGPTSRPTWRRSHFDRAVRRLRAREQVLRLDVPVADAGGVAGGDRVQQLLKDQCNLCPGQKSPFWAVKRPARPYKWPIQIRFTAENAKGAEPPRAGGPGPFSEKRSWFTSTRLTISVKRSPPWLSWKKAAHL
jgi:hypothetical protein